jgi:hypothetical protein
MALTKRAALAMAATLLLVAGCSGDDEPAAGESPTASSTPTDSGPATEPGAGETSEPTPGDRSTPSGTPTESDPVSSGHIENCTLGAAVIKARIAGAKGEQDPVEPGQPKDGSCTWSGQLNRLLIVSTDEPSEFTPIAEAKKRLGSSAEVRLVSQLGSGAWLSKVSTALTVEFKTTGLRVRIDGSRIEEDDLLAIAKAVHTDTVKIS